jgi:hypothetical protein
VTCHLASKLVIHLVDSAHSTWVMLLLLLMMMITTQCPTTDGFATGTHASSMIQHFKRTQSHSKGWPPAALGTQQQPSSSIHLS